MKSRRAPLSPVLAILATLLIVVEPTPTTAQQETFEEVISVVEVEIPVQVMSGGKPVGGLTRENFRIFDRGEEREVVGFRVVDLTTTTPGQADPSQVAAIEALDLPSERFFLAVVDTVNSERALLARSVANLRDGLLERMHPSDRAGVVIYNSRGPQLILGFTRDRQDLDTAMHFIISGLNRDDEERLAAAEALKGARATNLADLADLIGPSAASALSDPGVIDTGNTPTININLAPIIELDSLTGGAAGRAGGSGIEEAFAIGVLQATAIPIAHIEQLAESLQDLATLLGRIKGQKHLLLLSGGVDGFDSLATRSDGFSNSASAGGSRDWTGGATSIGRSISKMADAFRRTGWQIDSFNAGRTGVRDAIDASMLGTFSAETGGKLYTNFADSSDAFSRLVETTSVTYWLTFHCEDLHADRDFRRLRVELVGGPRGANVRARDGYYGQERGAGATALETRLDEAEDLLYGPDRHDFPVRLTTLKSPTADGQTRISLLAWTDGAALLQGHGDSAQLAVHAVARKPQSAAVLDLMAEFPRLDLIEARTSSAGKGIQFVGDLVVPEGSYDVRFRIANRTTGEAFVQTLPVTAEAQEQWSLVGPMVLQSPERAPVLISESSANLGTDLWSPFTSNGRMFVPAHQVVLSEGRPLAMHLKLFGPIEEELYFEATLRSDENDDFEVEIPLEVHETHHPDRQGAPASVLVTAPPMDLDPGTYELEVLWHDGLDDLAGAIVQLVVVDEE